MPQMQTLLSQERFLARLCQLKESRYYIWKGGSLLLRLYQHLEVPRFTVDIDFLVRGMEIVQVQDVFLEAIKIDLDDGFHFKSLSKSKMERETPYGGDRFEITWSLFDRGQSESLKIDVCSGDDVDAKLITSKDLFLLPEVKEVSLSVYPAEFIFAEKLETADLFYTGNTRLKDFIDLWGLIKHPMNPEKLKTAIERCFTRRKRQFSIERYQQLFTNTDFIDLMESARQKNYQSLSLPPVATMFSDVLKFILHLYK